MKAGSSFLCCISLGAALALASCIPPRFHRIQPGMNKPEVLHFVGEPRKRTYDDHFEKGGAETWYFDFIEPHTRVYDPHFVRFIDGRVTVCEPDSARITEVKRERAEEERLRRLSEIIPTDVGFKCDDGMQCQSRKCLEHKCAGPRDCVRGSGADCTADSDCCTLRCNQGARRCY